MSVSRPRRPSTAFPGHQRIRATPADVTQALLPMNQRSLVTYPYLLCDSRGDRCIVANPQRSTEAQNHTELLFVL